MFLFLSMLFRRLGMPASCFLLLLLTAGCQAQPEGGSLLEPKAFAEALAKDTSAFLLDVRTINEVERGRIAGARHLDFYNKDFKAMLQTIDRNQAVYVYCGSGLRSREAAYLLQQAGFSRVYDLAGGIVRWKLDGMPVTPPLSQVAPSANVLSAAAFQGVVATNRLVLVDFFAPWCGPCKVMVPALDSMKQAMGDSVLILSINADDHLHLMKEMKFNSIPFVMVFKDGKPVFRQSGFMEKKDMEGLVRRFYP